MVLFQMIMMLCAPLSKGYFEAVCYGSITGTIWDLCGYFGSIQLVWPCLHVWAPLCSQRKSYDFILNSKRKSYSSPLCSQRKSYRLVVSTYIKEKLKKLILYEAFACMHVWPSLCLYIHKGKTKKNHLVWVVCLYACLTQPLSLYTQRKN